MRPPSQTREGTRGAYKRHKHNLGVTEIEQIPNRAHSLTIDSGWREVCDRALAFVQRLV